MEPLPYLKDISLKRVSISDMSQYPFSIPAVRELDFPGFGNEVAYFVGDTGSGKTTLLEVLAIVPGFNPEGGTKIVNFETRNTHS